MNGCDGFDGRNRSTTAKRSLSKTSATECWAALPTARCSANSPSTGAPPDHQALGFQPFSMSAFQLLNLWFLLSQFLLCTDGHFECWRWSRTHLAASAESPSSTVTFSWRFAPIRVAPKWVPGGLFCFGRLIFWIGFRRGPVGRAFGFALTFYPSVGALLLSVFLLLRQ